MGAFTSSLMAVGIGMQAFGQYQSGVAQAEAASYNANIYNMQANMIEQQKKLVEYRQDKLIRRVSGETISAVASSGYDFSGSFLEVYNDNMTEAFLDREVALYNLEVDRVLAKSKAYEAERQGTQAKRAGAIGALSTILQGGSKWYREYGGFGKAPKSTYSSHGVSYGDRSAGTMTVFGIPNVVGFQPS